MIFSLILIKTLQKKSVFAKVDGKETNAMNLSALTVAQIMLFVRSLMLVNVKKVGVGIIVRMLFVRKLILQDIELSILKGR